MVEIGDEERGRKGGGVEWSLHYPTPRYRFHVISRTSPRAARLRFGGITFMELSNGLSSMGHGGGGFPTVLRNVKTAPVDQILQLSA